ncbi:hypothetical protein [Streptomyces hilarionis]|uniref:hypothetical protein n=1 Tax=Streptomyces hilarionis TaxID=2839954 RepID=UPI00211A7533|nr:hypothetical protein [Streptomyces hilarionis]MCQ9132662.1 hypothetical protein [Streptomyces hilarionis]
MNTRAATVGFVPTWRALAALLGLGAFGLGALAVFMTQNGTGSAALIMFGGVLLILAMLGSRIESLEFGGAKLRMRAAAADRFALAEESERRGDIATATKLRAEASALMDAASPIAADYSSIRSSMRPGASRTQALEGVVARARRLAQQQSFEPAEVLHWLQDGTEEQRITALAMMQASPELRDFEATLTVIAQSRTPFEQYHAMLLAAQMIDALDADQARRLAQTVEAQRGVRFRMDSDRQQLGMEILRKVRERSQGH